MFPSVSSCASTKKESRSGDKHGRRRPSLIFLVIASPQQLLDGFEWNLPIVFVSMPSCACTEKIRSIDKFGCFVPGSDPVKFPIDMLVIASPPRWSDYFRSWSKCSPQCLVVQVLKQFDLSKNMAAVGHLWFFLLYHLLRNYWVDSNETCLIAPQYLVVQAPNQILVGRQISERICHTGEEFARICHTCEKFERILHRCDKYMRIPYTSKIRYLWKTRTY